jgi:hypothetical protein
MAKKKRDEQLSEPQAPTLPPGVKLLRTLEGHKDVVISVAFDPAGRTLASGSNDYTVKLWDVATGKLLRTLEGHTRGLEAVAFSADGRILASKSNDGDLRLWSCETWETVAIIPEPKDLTWWMPSLAFHPILPLLVTVGSKPDVPEEEQCRLIHFWELDSDVLLGKVPEAGPAMQAVHHTTAKTCWSAIRVWARRDWAGDWRMGSSKNILPPTDSSSGFSISSARYALIARNVKPFYGT